MTAENSNSKLGEGSLEILKVLSDSPELMMSAAMIFEQCKTFESARDVAKTLSAMHKNGRLGRKPGGDNRYWYSTDPKVGEWNQDAPKVKAMQATEVTDDELERFTKAFPATSQQQKTPVIEQAQTAIDSEKLTIVNNELASENEQLRRQIDQLAAELHDMKGIVSEQENALNIAAEMIETGSTVEGFSFSRYVVEMDSKLIAAEIFDSLEGAKSRALELAAYSASEIEVHALVAMGHVERVVQWADGPSGTTG